MIERICILSSKPSFGICLASFPFGRMLAQTHIHRII